MVATCGHQTITAGNTVNCATGIGIDDSGTLSVGPGSLISGNTIDISAPFGGPSIMVNLPELQIRLTMGERLPSPPRTGRPDVRTHGTIALVLGAAAYAGTRRAVGAELARAITRRGCYHASAEQLTPVLRDPPSAAAAAFIIGQAFASPRGATEVASKAVARYSITPKAVEALAADTQAA